MAKEAAPTAAAMTVLKIPKAAAADRDDFHDDSAPEVTAGVAKTVGAAEGAAVGAEVGATVAKPSSPCNARKLLCPSLAKSTKKESTIGTPISIA